MAEDHDDDTERKPDSKKLADVHDLALERFSASVDPQLPVRELSLLARRFNDIPGEQWTGAWGEQWENAIKVEHNKVGRAVRRIENDYRQNRIVPDFRPAGGEALQETADTLDGLHRADSYYFKAQQARDNAFSEMVRGGFGAYRLTHDLADPYDKDSDEQRINPGLIIVDADQRVFFDPNSKLYDKSDAEYAFVLTAVARGAFEKDHPGCAVDWPVPTMRTDFPMFTPDVVIKCEYYLVEEVDAKLLVLTHGISKEERREWAEDMGPGEIADLRAEGWRTATKLRKRRRIRKYTMTGAEVLSDDGYIAGAMIPVVPVYGQRSFIDNQEVFKGHVQDKMDLQRLYNSNVSKLAETNALAPREVPIFLAEQMPPHLANLWANQNLERHAYALVEPVRDENGQIVASGPIGKIEPPQLSQVQAALLSLSNQDLIEEDADGADEVKANVSAEAMDIAATRVDAKSGIYLDNMAQSVQREAEIYLSMAADIYFEPGRVVETMDEDGGDGEAVLHEPATDATGRFAMRNDFARGRYKVIASVTEATATRRDKTVKSMLNTANVAQAAGDQELASVSILTAVMNQDGEGLSDMQAYARKRLVSMGVVKPTEEEQKQIDQAQEEAQPDAAQAALLAQAKDLEASAQEKTTRAALNEAKAGETDANTGLKRAQTVETIANAHGAHVDSHVKLNPPANDQPRIRMGRDLKHA
jgi:hypothetical protein